jgi:hypothetical protein
MKWYSFVDLCSSDREATRVIQSTGYANRLQWDEIIAGVGAMGTLWVVGGNAGPAYAQGTALFVGLDSGAVAGGDAVGCQ